VNADPNYLSMVTGPFFQDTTELNLLGLFGASTYDLFIIDKQGKITFIHSPVSLPNDAAAIESELISLL
jgi:peroxiredoxin